MTLDKVKLQDLEEKKQRAADDFSENTNWQTKLRYMPRSKCLENSVWNLMLILNNDPDFANIAFNELVGRVQITGAIPWTRPSDNKFWRDADTAQLKALIDIRYETFSSRNHDVAFTKVVEDRHFNPLRDWIDALPEWDGVVRLENLYIDFLGANNTGYVKAATRKSFVAAVARIYEPGTKFDSVVVLVGPQGCGKSTIESHPRQCIIVGTTNSETGFLRDITGNRRFWPIKVTGQSKRKSWDITREEVLQMWAEAKYLYGQGEPLYLNSQESSEALSEQIDAMESDERQGMVEEYLNTLLPDNWSHMDLYERRNFLTDNTAAKGTVQRKSVSNAEIWSECFCRNLSDLKPSDSYAIAALMTKVDGWQRTDKIRKLAIYGRQRIYERL